MIAALARIDQIAVLAALGALLVCSVEYLRVEGGPRRHRGALWAGSLLLLALAVRLAVPPAFVHSNFHGYGLVVSIDAFPEPAVTRAYFGQTSFVVLGALARLAEDPWRAVVVANVVAAVIGLGLLGWLAARAGGPVAGAAVLALGLLHPGLIRVAASEDAHNVGLLFGALALVGADAARRAERPAWPLLGLTAAACVLAVYGRHTFHIWPVVTLALLLPAGRIRHLLRSRSFLVVLGLAAVACLPRLAELMVHPKDSASYRALALFSGLWTDGRFLLRHPFLRLDESALLTPLALLGLISGWHGAAARTVRVLAVAVAVLVVMTLGFSVHPSYNEEYAFRLPLLGLWLVLAGVGAANAVRWLRARHLSRVTGAWGAAAGVAVLAASPGAGLARILADPDPQQQEVTLVQLHARRLGPGCTAFYPRTAGPYPVSGYRIPMFAFEVAGWRASDTLPDEPPPGSYVFQGLGCFAWSLFEIGRFTSISALLDALEALPAGALADLSADLWDDPAAVAARFGWPPPDGMRPECRRAAERGGTFIPFGEVRVARQQLPHVFFTRRRVPVGVWKLPDPAP